MEENNNATETTAPAIAPEETVTLAPEDDTQAQLEALEAEKAHIQEERDNYKAAYLKEVEKKREVGEEESDEDRIRRVTRETLAEERMGELDKKKDELLTKALKENSELKLAQLNKTTAPPAAMGGHSEAVAPTDTRVTPEQLAAFKAKGWSDQDIERYKRNLAKNSR